MDQRQPCMPMICPPIIKGSSLRAGNAGMPVDGLEPPTLSSSGRRSTTELNRRGVTGGSRTLIYGTTTRGFSVKLQPQYPWTVTLRLFLRVKQVRYFYNTGAFNGDFLFLRYIPNLSHQRAICVCDTLYFLPTSHKPIVSTSFYKSSFLGHFDFF